MFAIRTFHSKHDKENALEIQTFEKMPSEKAAAETLMNVTKEIPQEDAENIPHIKSEMAVAIPSSKSLSSADHEYQDPEANDKHEYEEPGEILLTEFSEHVRKLHENNNELFLKEYEVKRCTCLIYFDHGSLHWRCLFSVLSNKNDKASRSRDF